MSKWQIVPIGDGFRFLSRLDTGEYAMLNKMTARIEHKNVLFDTKDEADKFIQDNFKLGGYKAEEIWGFR